MHIVHHPLAHVGDILPRIPLRAERAILAKRRWRGPAEDGMEFGFDLESPLRDGDAFFATAAALYVVAQRPETVIEITLNATAADAARLGWLIGNLHFLIEVGKDAVWVNDDPAVRQMLTREHVVHKMAERVFHPLGGGHSHGH